MTTSYPRHGLARRLIGFVLVCLLFPAAVFGNERLASEQPAVTFGCEATAAPMVIANVNCAMGVASAFDIDQSHGLAPWCDDQVNLTVYGCAVEHAQNQQVSCHLHVPTLHPDGALRAAQNPCDGDEWAGGMLVRLATSDVVTDRCVALTPPSSACFP